LYCADSRKSPFSRQVELHDLPLPNRAFGGRS
jgi:hypothetical protein